MSPYAVLAAALFFATQAVAGEALPPVAPVAPATPVLSVAPVASAPVSAPVAGFSSEPTTIPIPQSASQVAVCPPPQILPTLSIEIPAPGEMTARVPSLALEKTTASPDSGQETPLNQNDLTRAINVPDRKEVSAIIKEFNSLGRSTMSLSLGRAGKYLPIIREELQALGLPEELAALPLVESSYNPLAVSTAGAVGLWQFIAATARLNGLRVDWWVDERLDPIASTKAAARHLKELYDRYGDWNLALAAYNAGAGFVDRAGGKKEGADFWKLCNADRMHSQTRRYVPKFYAALAIMGDPLAHGFDPMDETGALAYDEVSVATPVSLAVIAERAGISYEDLSIFNPGLKRGCTPPGEKPYLLRVPRGRGETIASIIADIPDEERLIFRKHKVKPGETIVRIAKKYGVEVDAIALMNGLKDKTRIKTGLELVIPVGGQRKSRSSQQDTKGDAVASPAHTIVKGDTLSALSRRYGTTVKKLMELNDLDNRHVLAVGEKIVVASPAE